MHYRWWAGHLIFTNAQVSALRGLQLIFIGLLFGSDMRVVTNGLSQWCRISLCSHFSFPCFQMKGEHTPALPQQGSMSTQVPKTSGSAELGSCCSVAPLRCNICKPLPCHSEQFPVYLVNSWAVSKVHHLNLESSWDSPTGPLFLHTLQKWACYKLLLFGNNTCLV